MKKSPLQTSIALCLSAAFSLAAPLRGAESIERSTITQVVRDVSVLTPSAKAKKSARVSDVFTAPDIMKTGPDSRAEMVAPDQTVTRVGANTLFSFEPQSREINLQKGSVLFNSPTGKGGGTIKTAAATASVLGTTLIVVTTQNGGFKALLLEGHGVVKSNGKSRSLLAGQMVYVLPGGVLSGVLNFHLAEQVGAARLVNGFKQPLGSKEKIEAAVEKQEKAIAKGQLVTTGLLASDSPTQAYKVDTTVALDVVRSPERVQAPPITSSAQAGLLDVTIATPQVEKNRIYTAATDIVGLFPGTNIADIPPSTSVFFARNTTVTASTIDLSAYPGTFVFYSTGDFFVNRSFSITGGLDEVGIIVSGTIRQAAGALISIDAKDAFVYGFGAVTANGDPFLNGGTPLTLVDGGILNTGSLFVFASSFDLNRSTLTAQTGFLEAFASGDFNAVGRGSEAPQFVAPESISLSAGNNMQLTNSVVSTLDTRLFATNDMTLTNVAFLTNGGTSSSVTAHAGNLMTINGAAFQAQSVALDARTLALTNVAFNSLSKVTLRSQTGLLAPSPNSGQAVQLGKVNFIHNVTYGGQPAQNYVDRGITITK